jgi:hypothetical protein
MSQLSGLTRESLSAQSSNGRAWSMQPPQPAIFALLFCSRLARKARLVANSFSFNIVLCSFPPVARSIHRSSNILLTERPLLQGRPSSVFPRSSLASIASGFLRLVDACFDLARNWHISPSSCSLQRLRHEYFPCNRHPHSPAKYHQWRRRRERQQSVPHPHFGSFRVFSKSSLRVSVGLFTDLNSFKPVLSGPR